MFNDKLTTFIVNVIVGFLIGTAGLVFILWSIKHIIIPYVTWIWSLV